jgi:hypothetical protein
MDGWDGAGWGSHAFRVLAHVHKIRVTLWHCLQQGRWHFGVFEGVYTWLNKYIRHPVPSHK